MLEAMLLVHKLLSALLFTCVIYRSCGLNETVFRRDILYIKNNIPFSIPNGLLADPVTNRDITYYLFNKEYENATIGRNLKYFNRKYPIKMLVHGWTEHSNVEWYKNTIREYMKKGRYNIIAVDWSLKGDTDYLTASMNSKPVGDNIGQFLVKIHDRKGVPYKRIHLISHSLGCHVAGFVGKRVFEITKRKIGRITGLDPAAPIFDLFTVGSTGRLSKKDAHFVDIIHTDGGNLGFSYPIGTADFFPNGGTATQPGCSLLKLDVKYEDLFCSHASSHQLFINSINKRRFVAKSCESWEKYTKGLCKKNAPVVFGEDVSDTVSGNLFFETKDTDINV